VASLAQSYTFRDHILGTGNTSQNSDLTPEIIELRAEVRLLGERLNDRTQEVGELKARERDLLLEKSRFVDLFEKQSMQLLNYHEPHHDKGKVSTQAFSAAIWLFFIVSIITTCFVAIKWSEIRF